MARPKKEASGEVEGLALIDIPRLGVKCGEWVAIQAEEAKSLIAAGELDTNAPKPE